MRDGRAEIFAVSDGTGETATAVVQAAMAQFQSRWRLRTFPDTRSEAQVRRVVAQAGQAGSLVVFTLVDKRLASALRDEAAECGVPVVDVLGPLLSRVAEHLGAEPQARPGLLHGLSDEHLRRVEAVEFAVRHDDGANLHTLSRADLVLAGPSRTSKTPLSIYLAQRGLRTGNVPILPGIEPPRELLDLDPDKVIGLVADAQALVDVRQARVRAMGSSPTSSYTDPGVVEQELRFARRLMRERGWRSIDVTGRAVEENAGRLLELLGAAGAPEPA
jgi:regulator of PEP synthase PpsR (kinase-PPPase family)